MSRSTLLARRSPAARPPLLDVVSARLASPCGSDGRAPTEAHTRWSPVVFLRTSALSFGRGCRLALCQKLAGTLHFRMLSHSELIIRIAVGAVLGGIIGYERDRHRRPVGLRTHLIVSLTAATFMVISSQFTYLQHYGAHDGIEVDASRIAASVVSAVGFLAGGAILRTGPTVQGLTTAAGLWLVTAIGMSCGAGMFVEGIAVTLLGLAALTVLRRFEDKEDNVSNRRVSVTMRPELATLERVSTELTRTCLEIVQVDYDSQLGTQKSALAIFDVRMSTGVALTKLVQDLELVPGVERVRVQTLG